MLQGLNNGGIAYRRHHRQFPPKSYKDLTKTDICQLGPILMIFPWRLATVQSAAFEQDTQTLVSNLPHHLKSKISWLTSLCSTHKKINPFVLSSFWKSFRHTIEDELSSTWESLRRQSMLSPSQAYHIDSLIHHQLRITSCSACNISWLTRNTEVLVALGAIIMATLNPNSWKRSKRLLFIETLIIGRQSASHAACSVEKMFDLGVQYRQLRDANVHRHRQRVHVDDAIAKYTAAKSGHMVWTDNERYQKYRFEVVNSKFSQKTANLEVYCGENVRLGSERPKKGCHIARKPVAVREDTEYHQESAEQSEGDSLDRRVRTASFMQLESIGHASTTDADLHTTHPGLHLPASSLSRQGEAFDPDQLSRPPEDNNHFSAIRHNEGTSGSPPSGERKRVHTHSLPNITIPRDHYATYGGLPANVLWEQHMERTAPKFRIGSDGTIKGPRDAMSIHGSVDDDNCEYSGSAKTANNWI